MSAGGRAREGARGDGAGWPRALALWMLGLALLAGCGPGQQGGSSGGGTECAKVPGGCAVEEGLTTIVTYLAYAAELCGAIVIAAGVLKAIITILPHLPRSGEQAECAKEDVRLTLGRSLVLALEFELAADILKTAVAPTIETLGMLAAIIVLRTLLNYVLEHELRKVEDRRKNSS